MLDDTPEPDFTDLAAAYGLPKRDRIDALLVECDPVDSMELVRIAARSQQLDIHVTACRSVIDASRALTGRRYDVIYLEYWLGEETSVPFIHEMSRAGTPCIVISDLNEPEIRRVAFRAGAQAFLAKDALCPQALESVTLAVLRPQLVTRQAA